MKIIILIFTGLVLLTSCSSSNNKMGTLTGFVEQTGRCGYMPDRNSCKPKPMSINITIKNKTTKSIISLKSNKKGQFNISLPAGEYLVEAKTVSLFLPAKTSVTVFEGKTTMVRLPISMNIR